MGDEMHSKGNKVVWKALFVFSLVLLSAGLACNPMNLLKSKGVRNLPGVQVLTGPVAPIFASSILDVRVPQAVAVNTEGTLLFVAEGDGERGIKVFDLSTRALLRDLVPPETTPGKRKPMSIALAPNGILFVVDRLRNIVDMYDPQGEWLGSLGEPPAAAGRWEPLSVAATAKKEVFVANANTAGPPVAMYDQVGKFLGVISAGGETPALSFPTGLAVLGSNNYIFVADGDAGRVVALDASGALKGIYGRTPGDSGLALPRGVAIDSRGYLHVVDVTADNIKVWDTKTDPATFLFTFGESGFADGQFLYPNSVAVDGNRGVYVADSGNDRVQIWSY